MCIIHFIKYLSKHNISNILPNIINACIIINVIRIVNFSILSSKKCCLLLLVYYDINIEILRKQLANVRICTNINLQVCKKR